MTKRQPDWTMVRGLALKAMANGGRMLRKGTVEWDISRRCERGVHVHLWARSDMSVIDIWDPGWFNASEPRPGLKWIGSAMRLNVEMTVPCRKCPPCLRDRGRQWANRAWSEIRASNRTWFGTITCEPEKHMLFLSRARVRLAEKDIDLEALSETERFREVEREINRELQLMVKRLRKAGHKFRFIVVCESSPDHQSGLPHYHMLLHEVGDPIKHRDLAGRAENRKRGVSFEPPAWPHGYSSFKLVDGTRKAAWYVCKYLNKDAKVRVRASKSYGREPEARTGSPDKKVGTNFQNENL